MAAIHDFLLFPHCDLHGVRTANPASGPQPFLGAAVRDGDDATQPTVMPITEVLPLPSSTQADRPRRGLERTGLRPSDRPAMTSRQVLVDGDA
jgi:hypothetical protein